VQVEDPLRLPEAQEVRVRLDEPGDRELPLEVDHLGVGAGELANLFVRPYRDDRVPACRERFRFRPRRVERDDVAVKQNEVRGLGRRAATGRERRKRRGSHEDEQPPHREGHLRFSGNLIGEMAPRVNQRELGTGGGWSPFDAGSRPFAPSRDYGKTAPIWAAPPGT
jgi:hypothetical protein